MGQNRPENKSHLCFLKGFAVGALSNLKLMWCVCVFNPVRPGMGPIYMNEVKCLGLERSIWNCPFKNITSEDCQHSEDAAVRCNIPYMGLENSVRAEPPQCLNT